MSEMEEFSYIFHMFHAWNRLLSIICQLTKFKVLYKYSNSILLHFIFFFFRFTFLHRISEILCIKKKKKKLTDSNVNRY